MAQPQQLLMLCSRQQAHVAQKRSRNLSAFRRYGFVSVCGFGNGGVISGSCPAGRRPLRLSRRPSRDLILRRPRWLKVHPHMLRHACGYALAKPVTTSSLCKPISDTGIPAVPPAPPPNEEEKAAANCRGPSKLAGRPAMTTDCCPTARPQATASGFRRRGPFTFLFARIW